MMTLLEWADMPSNERPEIRTPRGSIEETVFGQTQYFNNGAVQISSNRRHVRVGYKSIHMQHQDIDWLSADTKVEPIG